MEEWIEASIIPATFFSKPNCEVMRFAAYSVASEAFVANGNTFIAQYRCLLWRNWLRKRYLVRSIGAERKMARNRNALSLPEMSNTIIFGRSIFLTQEDIWYELLMFIHV